MATSVSRCSAIAAHGRRCQQSRYKGSPYCWHHMQSRKVPAPSRITAGRPRSAENAVPVELAAVSAAKREAEIELGTRLVRSLGRATAAEVLRVMESEGGSITLIRHAGGVSVWNAPERQRRSAQA
jgi:hypothetical protein